MSQTQNETCAELQERLPQLFESEVDLNKEPHLESCANCAELVRDLRYIANAAKLLMPIHDPAPGVWNNIRSAIESGSKTGEAG